MNKLWYLTKLSLKKKMATKWFLIANLILCLILIALTNIDSIIKIFGGDFEEVDKIIVIDNTNKVYDEFFDSYNVYNNYFDDDNKVDINLYEKSIEEAKEEVKEDDKILLVVNNDDNNFIKAEIITNKKINAITAQIISAALNKVKEDMAMEYYNISIDLLDVINNPVVIEKTRLDDSRTVDETMELVMSVAFPIIILPFFMLVMYLVQMIGAEVNEEKTTKSMEIIISNVSPKTHFLSKIIAGNVFVLSQGLLLILFAIFGVVIRLIIGGGTIVSSEIMDTSMVSDTISMLTQTGFLSNLSRIIPIMIILMLLTFLAYSLMAGILASMTTNMEDFQQLQTPIMVISLIGYFLSMAAGIFEGSLFIRIMSYIPFISSMLAPALLMLGQISIIDVVISIVLLIITNYLLIKYGLKIYKVGILNYSSNNLWKKMFHAIKK